ncbi:aldose epimerase family protein [Bacteroides sp. 519]|uniref:aldose epimerase family protein n=1 Tax=Bacteroides sp. 519 TaxID=2302937 RepID=UPI0013D53E4F|nr:aldose epimerase family protein [Bacteroides sp. 519]NDV58293.1 galactose mutarotase [Bacteroides sp. 519]
MKITKFICMGALIALMACTGQPKSDITLLDKSAFETTVDGKPVSLYTLNSGNGLTIQVTNFGLRVISIWTPDKNGKYADVAIGYENIDRYLNNNGERFLGPVVGRYANRIANGKFEIDGVEYQLPINNNGQTLHGGLTGLDMVAWNVDKVTDNAIQFSYLLPDGTDGFPGNLKLNVSYTLSKDNEFIIDYKATTDKPTVVNLSNHAFFNLKGEANGTITDHILTINASYTTPVNEVLIPSGEIAPVGGTPFDFRKATAIGERINQDNEQLKNGLGYDHNWVLDKKNQGTVELAVTLYEPTSGRVMEVYTDQPGVQFYSGNFFDGKTNGKYGRPIAFREALALETQKFPDSPNHPNFPSTRLNPGETYTQTCIYKFSIKQ